MREKYLAMPLGDLSAVIFLFKTHGCGGFGMTDKGRMADREEAENQEETAVQAEVVNRMETGKDPRGGNPPSDQNGKSGESRSVTACCQKTGGSGDHAVAADRGEIPGRNGNPGCIRAEMLWYLTENIDRKTEGKLCHCNL